MHFVGTSRGTDTSSEERAVTCSQSPPVPAPLRLSGFRSQSYDTAHSAAAQHAPLFICCALWSRAVCAGFGFSGLLLALCL
ncbi:hypothetical protein CesoFtcFv8_020734 [Champsocephalus esox]|uniref:Uncharacterized protein n=1 Tax=Champsocephalus esox TaxID=159716 RepID=A0AAN8BBS4_9TELE|nr:hypothetical protein CesoFtcFv8_020734 [Champsocephalus esox]